MSGKRAIIKVLILAAAGIYLLWQNGGKIPLSAQPTPPERETPATGGEKTGQGTVTTRRADGSLVHAGFGKAGKDAVFNRTIVRISDGDTLVISVPGGGMEKVRLLGVDTPEKFESDKLEKQAGKLGVDKKTLTALGEKSSAYTAKLCAGHKCRLELDARPKDDYGRTLGYIHLDNGICLNEELVRSGYASVYKWFTYSQREHFLALEKDARKNRRGLWADPLFIKITDN